MRLQRVSIVLAVVLGVLIVASSTIAQQSTCIDINTASSQELERIIHIGPDRSAQIIQLRNERPFRNVDELVRVKGIAAARLADIKKQGLACVR